MRSIGYSKKNTQNSVKKKSTITKMEFGEDTIPNLNTIKNLKRFSHIYKRETGNEQLIKTTEKSNALKRESLMKIDIKKMQRDRRRRSSIIPGMIRPINNLANMRKDSIIPAKRTRNSVKNNNLNSMICSPENSHSDKENLRTKNDIKEKRSERDSVIKSKSLKTKGMISSKSPKGLLKSTVRKNLINEKRRTGVCFKSQNQVFITRRKRGSDLKCDKFLDPVRVSRFRKDEKRRQSIWKRQFKSCDFVSNLQMGEKMKRLNASNRKFLKQRMKDRKDVPLLVYHKRYLALHEILSDIKEKKKKRRKQRKKCTFKSANLIFRF